MGPDTEADLRALSAGDRHDVDRHAGYQPGLVPQTLRDRDPALAADPSCVGHCLNPPVCRAVGMVAG